MNIWRIIQKSNCIFAYASMQKSRHNRTLWTEWRKQIMLSFHVTRPLHSRIQSTSSSGYNNRCIISTSKSTKKELHLLKIHMFTTKYIQKKHIRSCYLTCFFLKFITLLFLLTCNICMFWAICKFSINMQHMFSLFTHLLLTFDSLYIRF